MFNNWLYIANWKSYLSYQQELAWFQQNLTELEQLALDLDTQNKTLVICPSFVTLAQAAELLSKNILGATQDIPNIPATSLDKLPTVALKSYGGHGRDERERVDSQKNYAKNLQNAKLSDYFNLQLGAQNCSSNQLGAYTGEIPVESLRELACSYCLVGHFERRKLFHETDLEIVAKIKLLIQAQITPVICISETQQLINILDNLTLKKTEQNNTPLAFVVSDLTEPVGEDRAYRTIDLGPSNNQIIIAYEPTWAIGTGKTPTNHEISQFCQMVKTIIETDYSTLKNYLIIYGGSVTAQNITELRQIPALNGVLVGKASINFQELKKIVLS